MKDRLNSLASIGFGKDDYIQMFALTQTELEMKILDCYPGVSTFALEVSQNNKVIAADPSYDNSVKELEKLTSQAQGSLLKEMEEHPERFAIDKTKAKESIEKHQKNRISFFNDFPQGQKEGRYIKAQLPTLPFQNEQFDLALVNHFLFTKSPELTVEFHVKSIQELTRVANEVRIFPLVTSEGEISRYVGEVASMLQMLDLGVEIRGVPFHFQKHDNAMMRIWTPSCSIR